MKTITFTILYLLAITTFGQQIQWASKIKIEFNTSLAKEGKSDGPAKNYAHDAGSKSSTLYTVDEVKPSLKRVITSFSRPQEINQVLIFENNFDGQVLKLILEDENGQVYRFLEKDITLTPNLENTLVVIGLPQIRDLVVSKLTMDIYSNRNPRVSPIDAIGLPLKPLDEHELSKIIPAHATKEYVQINELNKYAPTFFGSSERINNAVNSQYLESKPLISPNGSRLFFVRKNAPTNYKGRKDDHDIYFSDLYNGKWTEARNIGEPLNDQFANGVCAISPDGNTMLVLNAYDIENNKKVYDGVSITRKTYEGWSQPIEQVISGFHNFCGYQDYYINNSGDVMLLAIQMEETYGDQDIYISYKTGENRWSKPVNLGSGINTEMAEFSPFLSPDNKVLYFASNGHGGYGNSDIFYSVRLDNTWKEWSEPINLGPQVNSSDWDAYFSITPRMDYAYFVSAGSAVKRTLYNPDDADIYRIRTMDDPDRQPVVIVRGHIINKKTNQPIGADILCKSFDGYESETPIIVDQNDGYTLSFDAGKSYVLNAQAFGFISETLREDFTNINSYTEIEKDIYISPMEIGSTFQIDNIFFVQSKSELLPESIPELEKLYLMMVKKPSMRIELGGHTDNQGSSTANLTLSEKRAEAVMNFLIERGISGDRLVAIGYGSSKPIASNRSLDSRMQNRRVEVKVLRF